jgi:hypothetical protein
MNSKVAHEYAELREHSEIILVRDSGEIPYVQLSV